MIKIIFCILKIAIIILITAYSKVYIKYDSYKVKNIKTRIVLASIISILFIFGLIPTIFLEMPLVKEIIPLIVWIAFICLNFVELKNVKKQNFKGNYKDVIDVKFKEDSN